MGIATHASNGVQVQTAAVNETIPAQTNVSDATIEIELSDDISTLSNGNLESSPVYVDRLIMIRQGTGTEETRRVIAASASGVGNTWILTVSEAWDSNPVGSTDTAHISYIIQDAATVTGLGLVNKTVQDYNSTRRFVVGNNAVFAWIAFIDGVSLQSNDNGSTTVADITVDADGLWDCGYIIGATPTAGAKIQLAPQTDAELGLEMISGARMRLYNTYLDSVKRVLVDFNSSTTSEIKMDRVTWNFAINDVIWGVQDTEIRNVWFLSDDTGTTPRIRVRDWAAADAFTNVVADTFNGFETETAGQDPELKNIEFINMSKLLTIATGETWTIINMVNDAQIDTASQSDVSIAGTGEALINNSVAFEVTDPTGTALTAKIYIITNNQRGGSTYNSRSELTADANGLANANVERRRLTNNAGTSLNDDVTTQLTSIIAEYGQKPFVNNAQPSNDNETSKPKQLGNSKKITLSDDEFQVQTTAATARTLGDTTNAVAIEKQTNPATLLKFTGGSGTDPTLGDTIGNSVNAAEGTLAALVEGDWTEGTLLLDGRNATAWETGAHTLDDAASAGNWTATFTAASIRSFSGLIDIDSLTAQELYDWFNAKLDEATLDRTGVADFDDILAWAQGGVNALPVVGVAVGASNTFKTVNETIKNEGWMVYDSSVALTARPALAAWTEFTDDTDAVFTPAITVIVKFTIIDDETSAVIPNARVAAQTTGTKDEVLNVLSNGSGIAQNAGYSLPVDPTEIEVHVVDIDDAGQNKPVKRIFNVTANGLDVTIRMPNNPQYTPTP